MRISPARGTNSGSHWSLRVVAFGPVLAATFLGLALLLPVAYADGSTTAHASTPAVTSRIPTTDPLNGGFLLVNMQGMLFHPEVTDIEDDLAYARWLGAGIVRVFATDSSNGYDWDGTHVGMRIAEIAPTLRAEHVRLIVAFVNNHRAVPGEAAGSAGWMDNYMQLLLPFYTTTWRGAYHHFVHDLVSTLQWYQAQDVIFAWELGNELHTPAEPAALAGFVTEAAAEVRALDPITPILPGTMGANHVEPGVHNSPIARWLYCEAPIDAYTLHAYDWVSRQQPGDMPIDWDFDNVLSQPCDNGRVLPVIVEELGTSRALAGVYTSEDEEGRLRQELHQIDFVRQFPHVVGFGVWNGESPRVVDRTFVDTRRGLTSYGSNAHGGGSCYDPTPDPTPGVRCQLEQILRGTTFLRMGAPSAWTPGPGADPEASDPVVGAISPMSHGEPENGGLSVNGWVLDPLASESSGVDELRVYIGTTIDGAAPIANAQLGLALADTPPSMPRGGDWANAGFSVRLLPGEVPTGTSVLTLAAHTPDRGTWLSALQVVIPNLGVVPPARHVMSVSAPAPLIAAPIFRAEIQSPGSGDQIPRSFVLQVLSPYADRVEVFLEPDRDAGGREVGFVSQKPGAPLKVNVNAPPSAHTLYVHVFSAALAQEIVLTLPVVVRS